MNHAGSNVTAWVWVASDEGVDRNPLEHIFFALPPDPLAGKGAVTIQRQLRESRQLRRGLTREDLLHVTVCAMPDYAEAASKDLYAKAVLAAVSSLQHSEARVSFDRVQLLGGGAYALTGDNPGVVELGKKLAFLLRKAGMSAEPQRTPHMTIAYPGGQPAPCSVQPLMWTAGEVVLIRSYPGESRHERLGSVPLTKPQLVESEKTASQFKRPG